MKIIKPGILPGSREFRATCPSCRAVVEFTQDEALQSTHRNEIYYSVTCPTPGCLSTISAEA